jgi:hypothetical protein
MEVSKGDNEGGVIQRVSDLNDLLINNEGAGIPLEHFAACSSGVAVIFKNLEQSLIAHIQRADIVVGCVAWLTNKNILRALSKKRGVALIVQKEDFLRPDVDAESNFKSKLRSLYESLPATLTRYDEGLRETRVYMMSCASDPTIEAVRCVGNYNLEKVPAFPRMHHKFVVFCRIVADGVEGTSFEPYEVWTGSFNFTENAARSFENALIIRDPKIVESYFQEFGQVEALSEPLRWDTFWAAPEWRIGT